MKLVVLFCTQKQTLNINTAMVTMKEKWTQDYYGIYNV